MNREYRQRALQMRLQGKSYNEITQALGIPKSTLSSWFTGMVLSEKAVARLASRVAQGTVHGLVKRNTLQTHLALKRAKILQAVAAKQIGKLDLDILRIVGAVLYWAEGYKRLKIINGKERTGHSISFVNADPKMITLFIRFLIEILAIPYEKIHAYMRLYPHISENEALRYWMQVTGLKKQSFGKTSYLLSRASQGRRPYNRLPYGTLQLQVYSTEKFHTLLGLIQGVKNSL